MRNLLAFIGAVLIGSASPGVSIAQRGLAPPRITVQSLEPLPAAGNQTRFRAVIRVDNLNTEPLKMRLIEFSLRLAHQGMIDVRMPGMTVEGLHQQFVTLEIGSEIMASAVQLLSFVQGPENTLPYELVGKVTFERGRIDPVNFSAEGQVPLVMTADR